MDRYIHTADGALTLDDPYRIVGTRGIHIVERHWGFIILDLNVEAALRYHHPEISFYLTWVKGIPHAPRIYSQAASVRESHTSLKKNFRIVRPGDKDYFEMEGY